MHRRYVFVCSESVATCSLQMSRVAERMCPFHACHRMEVFIEDVSCSVIVDSLPAKSHQVYKLNRPCQTAF